MRKHMSDRIIFLDVDGVLNCTSTGERVQGVIGIDPKKVRILKRIAEENRADIVLTSTWKEDWARWDERPSKVQSEFGDYLDEKLAEAGLRIRDKTEDDWWNRGQGIVRWLKSHLCRRYIVLDDEMFEDFKACGVTRHLVKTSFETGLQECHVMWARLRFLMPVRIPEGWEDVKPTRWRNAHWGK